MSQYQNSPNKKQEDKSENGSAEQDLGGCVYQPVTVDCRVGQFINIPLPPPSGIACVDVVVLGGARHLLHHQGFTGEETLEDSPWETGTHLGKVKNFYPPSLSRNLIFLYIPLPTSSQRQVISELHVRYSSWSVKYNKLLKFHWQWIHLYGWQMEIMMWSWSWEAGRLRPGHWGGYLYDPSLLSLEWRLRYQPQISNI